MEEIKGMLEALVIMSSITLGLVMGISVILLAFGPALWTLCREQKLRKSNKDDDLRY